jgi:hypothetical protein
VSQKDYTQLKLNEINKLTDFLPCISKPIHQNSLNQEVQLIEESSPMHKSCELAETELSAISCEETWHNSNYIKNQ